MVGSSFNENEILALVAEIKDWICNFSYIDSPLLKTLLPENYDRILGCGILTTVLAFIGISRLKNIGGKFYYSSRSS